MKGPIGEPVARRCYLVRHRPSFLADAMNAADRHNGRSRRNPAPEVDARITDVVDLEGFEQNLRELGAVPMESVRQRRRDLAERDRHHDRLAEKGAFA